MIKYCVIEYDTERRKADPKHEENRMGKQDGIIIYEAVYGLVV